MAKNVSADITLVTFTGGNTHRGQHTPAYGKDKMLNASRATGHFLAGMPIEFSPEGALDPQCFAQNIIGR